MFKSLARFLIILPVVGLTLLLFNNSAKAATIDVQGTAYSDEGVTNLGDNKTVSLLINGNFSASAETDVSGAYSFTGLTLADSDILTLYLDDETEKGVTLVKISAGATDGTLNTYIYQDNLIFDTLGSDPFTATDYNIANDIGDADIDLFYINGVDLIVGNSKALFITGNTTFQTSGNLFLNGNLKVASGGSIDAVDSALYIEGNLDVQGQIDVDFVHFIGTAGNQNVTQAGTLDARLSFDKTNADGDLVFQSNINITGTNDFIFTQNGTVDCNGHDLNAGNLTINTGTYTCATGALSANGTITTGAADAVFSGGSGTIQATSILISDGQFTASSNTTTINDSLIFDGGTFNHNSGEIILEGVSNAITTTTGVTDITLYSLQKVETNDSTDSTITVDDGLNINIEGTLTLDGFDANDKIKLRSSSGTAAFTFTMSGASAAFGTTDYLDVQNNTILNSSAPVVLPINPAHSLNSGGTLGWFGVSLVAGSDVSEFDFAGTFVAQAGAINNTGADITIDYQFKNSSTATAGIDFDDSTTSVVIPQGEDSAVITVPVYMDNDAESTETIVLSITSASDYDFDSGAEATINLLDHANININPQEIATTEGSISQIYQISLSRQPTDNVVIDIMPDSESTVDISQVMFTTDNWDAVTITVTAVDDGIFTGQRDSTITNSVNQSLTLDSRYLELVSLPSVINTITDDEFGPTATPTMTPTNTPVPPTPTETTEPAPTVPTATPVVHHNSGGGGGGGGTVPSATPTITPTLTETETPTPTATITEDSEISFDNEADNNTEDEIPVTPTKEEIQTLPETGSPIFSANLVVFLIILIASGGLGAYFLTKHHHQPS